MRNVALFIVGIVGLSGCTTHLAPYHTKRRNFETGEYGDVYKAKGSSIYASGSRGLFEDDRANRVGDLVVIQVDEADSAMHDSSTKTGSKNANSVGFSGGVTKALETALAKVPGLSLEKLFGSNSEFAFNGEGSVQRQGRLRATLPVRVRQILPNSDLVVEGTKAVMVGNEEHHLYISGIIRQIDLQRDGSVASSRVADAEIEYTGRGDVSDNQRPGWLSRVFTKIWPF